MEIASKQYGLIGYPLGHSFSKLYFTDKFEKEGITDCAYSLFPLTSIDDFPALLKSNPSLKGINVTIPYKEQVLPFVQVLTDEVKSIGAANCLAIKNNVITAHNTDITGFQQSFCKFLQPHHTKALILGTGGASKAIQYVLDKIGISFLIVSRHAGTSEKVITYDQLNSSIMQEYSVIINCSPVGMFPNEQLCPDIPYHLLTQHHYLYDLVYKPALTLFLQRGKEKNATVVNGYEMLIIQAEESWRIWNTV